MTRGNNMSEMMSWSWFGLKSLGGAPLAVLGVGFSNLPLEGGAYSDMLAPFLRPGENYRRLTLFLGCSCDGILEGFAAGAVSSTDSTLVLLLGGAHHAVAAHLLLTVERAKKKKFSAGRREGLAAADALGPSPHTRRARTHCGGPCRSSACHP